jgi:hypothetical protein
MAPLKPRGPLVVVTDHERTWQANGWRTEAWLPQPFDGDEWEMMGFESGRFVGWPQEILEMYRQDQIPYAPGEFGADFRFATVRMFGPPHAPAEPGGFPLVDEKADDAEDAPQRPGPVNGAGNGLF